jgi:diacyltrehalose acyltransferase
VAKHRKPDSRPAAPVQRAVRERRQSPSLLLGGTTAAALSTVLVFGHATNTSVDNAQVQLAAVTIGIGGRGDPDAANIPHKLNGTVVPNTFSYIPVQYPAGFDIDNSVNAGVPVLDQTVKDNSNQFLAVVAYSEGTLVSEKVRRELDPADPGAPPKDGLLFVMIASPNLPNGGIYGRFPGLKIPFVLTSTGPAQPSVYDTTYVTNEYDPYADFPAYFNLLSLANTLVAIEYVHQDQSYDPVDYNPLTGGGTTPVLVKTVSNSAGGTDTYVFVPADQLPLLAPVRQAAAMAHVTLITEPVLGAVEPLLRVLVDMGYTDRENLNPETPVTFSFITPRSNVLEAAAEVPGALEQGAHNFVTGVEAIPGSLPRPLAPTNSPSIDARSIAQQPQQSQVNDDQPPNGATDPVPPKASSGPGTASTEAPVATLSNSGPTLGEVTGDGNKTTPNTSTKTTSPEKNSLTQLADSFKGFRSGKKTPTSSTPSSEPQDSAPSTSPSRGQSQGPASNAA